MRDGQDRVAASVEATEVKAYAVGDRVSYTVFGEWRYGGTVAEVRENIIRIEDPGHYSGSVWRCPGIHAVTREGHKPDLPSSAPGSVPAKEEA